METIHIYETDPVTFIHIVDDILNEQIQKKEDVFNPLACKDEEIEDGIMDPFENPWDLKCPFLKCPQDPYEIYFSEAIAAATIS